jgi:hypothetical protein
VKKTLRETDSSVSAYKARLPLRSIDRLFYSAVSSQVCRSAEW